MIHPMVWDKPSISKWSWNFHSCVAFCDQVIHEIFEFSTKWWVSVEPLLHIPQYLHSLSFAVWYFQTLVSKSDKTSCLPAYFVFSSTICKNRLSSLENSSTSFKTLLFTLIVLSLLKSLLYIVWNIFSRLTLFMASSITEWWLEIFEYGASITATWLQPIIFLLIILIMGPTMHQPSLVWQGYVPPSTFEITFDSNVFM